MTHGTAHNMATIRLLQN